MIWKDPDGWHKMQCEGVPIDVVPEGRKPRKDAPAAIPGPEQLGVPEGAAYAEIAGWMETKLGSYRVQDRADVVQVIKVTSAAALRRIRKSLGKRHVTYLQRFEELLGAAKEEQSRSANAAELNSRRHPVGLVLKQDRPRIDGRTHMRLAIPLLLLVLLAPLVAQPPAEKKKPPTPSPARRAPTS